MKRRLLEYRKRIDALLEGGEDFDRAAVTAEHLVQISFFQHERLIHLIVTVTFAVLEFLAVILAALMPCAGTLALCGAIAVLLIPYIRHYYLLENEVQRLYRQYDELVKRQ
ncbi:MAG: hypothetical protein GX051_04775 [Clostridiales bacterium]|jgi:hypothetical protein|nr:hypothetical protein [Clostridiales bacterium]